MKNADDLVGLGAVALCRFAPDDEERCEEPCLRCLADSRAVLSAVRKLMAHADIVDEGLEKDRKTRKL